MDIIFTILLGFVILCFLSKYDINIVFLRLSEKGLFSPYSFKLGLSWIVPILGFIGYILIYSKIITDTNYKEIILKISDVLVIGGVVGFLSNATLFMGIFKKELEDIVYSVKFLNTRNDISDIWRKTSKALFNQKFPDISEELLSLIEDHYISNKESYYYENYRSIIDIQWADPDNNKDFVIVTDTINFDLVAEKKDNIEIPFSSWINIQGLAKEDFFCNFKCTIDSKEVKPITSIEIDGEKVESEEEVEITEGKKNYKKVCKINLCCEKERYNIMQKREKKYKLTTDFDLSFRVKYIVKNLSVTLNTPHDINAAFICRGTPKDFIEVKNTKTCKEYTYKGLILQRQGYIFALHKVNL